jgi:hypothetical protein
VTAPVNEGAKDVLVPGVRVPEVKTSWSSASKQTNSSDEMDGARVHRTVVPIVMRTRSVTPEPQIRSTSEGESVGAGGVVVVGVVEEVVDVDTSEDDEVETTTGGVEVDAAVEVETIVAELDVVLDVVALVVVGRAVVEGIGGATATSLQDVSDKSVSKLRHEPERDVGVADNVVENANTTHHQASNGTHERGHTGILPNIQTIRHIEKNERADSLE